MKRLIASLALVGLTVVAMAVPPTRAVSADSPAPAYVPMCDMTVIAGVAQCAVLRFVGPANANPAGSPAGYGPADLQSAYELPSAMAGQGQTVAIVAAFDDPNAESDLAVYRKTFGLPPCSSASGCLRKVNQNGQPGPLPPANRKQGWQVEESLDLDMVSAICPRCHLLLVEANNSRDLSLALSVDTAARLGAQVIIYGGSGNMETPNEATVWDPHFNHPGSMIIAGSSSDSFGPHYPAASPYVTAVGGTSLRRAPGTKRGWVESSWGSSSGINGCSQFEPRPQWQRLVDTECRTRSIADVAAVADPVTGVAMYDTFNNAGGWIEVGGISVPVPIIAGVYALAGNASSLHYGSYPYSHRNALYDIAPRGYDYPTGLGTPDGTSAF